MAQNKVEIPNVLKGINLEQLILDLQEEQANTTKINLNELITDLIEKQSNTHEVTLEELISELKNKQINKTQLSQENYQFAKKIIEQFYLKDLRADNFCLDLTKSTLADNLWSKEESKAFAKLLAKFSDKAAELLKQKQEQKLNINNDAQLLWIKLPKNNEALNRINKILANNGYEDKTGNEEAITLLRYINSKKQNPIVRFPRVTQSVSVVIVVKTNEGDKALLLKRAGQGNRVGTYGTLTGIKETNETKEKTVIREVDEEINVLLHDKPAYYLGSAHTVNFNKDLVEKGKAVSYSDDCSYVYGIRISEEELLKTIKLDEENSKWKLFSKEELLQKFKAHNPDVHGANVDPEEKHVALAKSLLALDCAANDFKTVEYSKFNYPSTNSHGFIAHPNSFFTHVQISDAKKEELQQEDLNTVKLRG